VKYILTFVASSWCFHLLVTWISAVVVYKTCFNKISGLPIFPLYCKFIWNWDFHTAECVDEYIEHGPQDPLILNSSSVFMAHWFTVLRNSVCGAVTAFDPDNSPLCQLPQLTLSTTVCLIWSVLNMVFISYHKMM